VLSNTDILFVAVRGVVVLGERLTPRQWLGLVVGTAGTAAVVLGGSGWPSGRLALGAGGGGRGAGLGARHGHGRPRGAREAAHGWRSPAGRCSPAGPRSACGALAEGGPERLGARELALVAGLALVGSAGPLACYYLALARAPAARVSVRFFLVPVVGVISAWPLAGERPGGHLLVGLVAISAGSGWCWRGAATGPGSGW
jgi:drug/metabolite transporter (DMT)-like permease